MFFLFFIEAGKGRGIGELRRMKIETGSKLLFIGDSITDCGRARPYGEGAANLGNGYVNNIEALIGATYPERKIRIVNVGTSGNTVKDLEARWDADVSAQAPDWLSVMIGTNDVWRQFDMPRQPEIHVLPAVYAETLDKLVTKTLPLVKGMVLMTPFYIEPLKTDAMRARMDEYGAIVKDVATKHGMLFVDTQAGFDAYTAHLYSGSMAWDRVHPNSVGHMIIAKAFLKAVGFVF
jgi:lysophospholipase L1-like esterase